MPQPIKADPFVQRMMETKGITSTVGVFGNHKIQFGSPGFEPPAKSPVARPEYDSPAWTH